MSLHRYSRLLVHTHKLSKSRKLCWKNAALLNVLNSAVQRQQLRSLYPVAGPPRFPMGPAKKLLLGWGSLAIMMIIPFWALFSIPAWSDDHLGIVREGAGEDDDDDEGEDEIHEDKEKK